MGKTVIKLGEKYFFNYATINVSNKVHFSKIYAKLFK